VLTRDDLLAALAAIHESASVRADEVTGSTNETAAAMAEAGAPAWSLVAAAHQTAGRGRLDRGWVDVPGRAVLLSVVLRPEVAPNRVGLLALAGGAAMARAIRSTTGRQVACKWPNDLLLDGRKVGGVLATSRIHGGRVAWVVIGVGVNVDAPPGIEGAGALGEVDPRALVVAFVTELHRIVEATEVPLDARVRSAWLPVASTIGELVEATTTDGAVVVGRAVAVDGFGGLVLSTDHGERTVAFGDVRHLRAVARPERGR
jgi:BirA family biotin operon repressor/biotin-[acetyl-CoA-carboxylase] ligase